MFRLLTNQLGKQFGSHSLNIPKRNYTHRQIQHRQIQDTTYPNGADYFSWFYIFAFTGIAGKLIFDVVGYDTRPNMNSVDDEPTKPFSLAEYQAEQRQHKQEMENKN